MNRIVSTIASVKAWLTTDNRTNDIAVFLFMLALSTTLFLTTSCDSHESIDRNIRAGNVLCSDGMVMTADDAESQGKHVVAVVFQAPAPTGPGTALAVAIDALPPQAFSDTIGVSLGTSADTAAYDGNTNTYAMYTASQPSSLAISVFDSWTYGQSAYIPSVAEMRLLHAAKDIVNPLLKRFGGDTISSEARRTWHWTSTEVSGQQADKAWLYSLATGTMQETPKNEPHPARAVVVVNK